MKKSLIALSLVSVFVTGTSSAAVNPEDNNFGNAQLEVERLIKDYDMKVEHGNHGSHLVHKDGHIVATTIKNKDGSFTVIDRNERDQEGNMIEHNVKLDSAGNVIEIDGKTRFDENATKPEIDQSEINRNSINNNASDIREIYEAGDAAAKYIDAAGRQAVEAVGKNTSDIADLRKDFNDMSQRQDRFEDKLNKMDKKMDGVMAGTHAVTNARPMVAGGQTAFGVGTGFAGSAQAVAVGVAHNFKDSAWSVSATTNVSTGSGVKTQVSGGVGAHYVF